MSTPTEHAYLIAITLPDGERRLGVIIAEGPAEASYKAAVALIDDYGDEAFACRVGVPELVSGLPPGIVSFTLAQAAVAMSSANSFSAEHTFAALAPSITGA